MALRLILYTDDATGLSEAIVILTESDSEFRDAASTFAPAGWTAQSDIQVDTGAAQFAAWPTVTWMLKS